MKRLTMLLVLVSVAYAQHARRCMHAVYDGQTGCYYAGDAGSTLGFCSCTVIHTPGTCITPGGVELRDEAEDPQNVECVHPCPLPANVCIIQGETGANIPCADAANAPRDPKHPRPEARPGLTIIEKLK